jgi:hypothetical protein
MFVEWRNNRREKRIKNKFLGLYMESVGRTYLSDPQNLGEFRRNKERHNSVWNKRVKPKDIRKYF